MKSRYLVILSLLLFSLGVTSSAMAVGRPDTSPVRPTGVPMRQVRLGELKLKACRERERTIANRADHLLRLVTNMEEKFDAISGRVQQYYTSTVLPGGRKIVGYDGLVADIQAKKLAVQDDLASAQQISGTFTCEGENPRGQLTQFRQDMQDVKASLKAYRTTIRNLIVAVHSGNLSPTGSPGGQD